MATVGRVIGKLVFESEGSLYDDVVEGEEALHCNRGTARAVEAVHEGVDAGAGEEVGPAGADGEDGGDSRLRGGSVEGVGGGAEDVDADGGHVALD